jgi:cell division protease FtsH
MEAYWGMGKTVSSSRASRRLEGETPGNSMVAATPAGDQGSVPGIQRLADRIEDNLSALLVRAEEILRENERWVLAVAHALESHKTFSGEDMTAIFEGTRGPLVDGTPYADEEFIDRLRDYHAAVARAHREHSQPDVPLPVPTPAYAIDYSPADLYGANGNGSGTGTGSFLDGGFGGNGSGTGNGSGNGTGGDDIIELGGHGGDQA